MMTHFLSRIHVQLQLQFTCSTWSGPSNLGETHKSWRTGSEILSMAPQPSLSHMVMSWRPSKRQFEASWLAHQNQLVFMDLLLCVPARTRGRRNISYSSFVYVQNHCFRGTNGKIMISYFNIVQPNPKFSKTYTKLGVQINILSFVFRSIFISWIILSNNYITNGGYRWKSPSIYTLMYGISEGNQKS